MSDTTQAFMKRTSLQIQLTVLKSLVLREVKGKYGEFKLGFMWALLEPLIHIIILSYIFGAIKGKTLAGIDFPIFVTLGVIPFLTFRKLISQCTGAIDGNSGLFEYTHVKPIDAVLARIIVEFLTAMLIVLIVFGFYILFGYELSIANPPKFIGTFALLVFFTSGLGLTLSVFGRLFKETKRIVSLFLRPIYFLSAIFYSIEIIPQPFRDYILWNPMLHIISLFRESLFGDIVFNAYYANPVYVFKIGFIMNFFGLLAHKYYAKRLLNET